MILAEAKDQLERWLNPFPIDDLSQIPEWRLQPHERSLPDNVEEIAEALRGCADLLPDAHCHKLGLPIASTYDQAGVALQMRAGQKAMYG